MARREPQPRPGGHADVMEALTTACRHAVLARCKRREVAKGQTLWLQGEAAHSVAIIVSGKVMSQYEARSGRSGTIGFWCTGDLVGLGDLGRRSSRQHTLRCLEACSFLVLPFDDVDDLIRSYPEFGIALVRALSLRLSWVTQLALGLETGSATERICTVLLALSERFGHREPEGVRIDLHLTHDQLAAIAGVTRQFTNSTLKLLRERGIISAGRPLVLTDLDALEHLAFS
ncbi:MAG: Crp/Fnr family transcriptional regulator [Burkholderiales bacterium]|nr:Crp/Fnr family transcriptional regulator [Burkholderiales bacterium]